MWDIFARRRALIALIYLTVLVFWNDPHPWLWVIGLCVAVAGEGIRTWASGYIVKKEKLSTIGPYSVVRNPLYLGSFILGFGICLMSGNIIMTVIYPLFFYPTYMRKIEQEEAFLSETFGDQMEAYMQDVPRLIPDLSIYQPTQEVWDIRRVVYIHKEWWNWLLIGLFILVLLPKTWPPV